MAKKISELTAITTIADNDLTPIVDTSETETKKMTASQMKTYAQGDLNTRLTTVETNGIIGATQYGGTLVTNFNTINKNGFYTGLGTATGVPDTNYSWFVTHQNSNTGTVSATQRAVAFSTNLIIYERTKISGTWGSWINTDNGWLPTGETWTYSSVDNPTGVITISGDKTGKYSLGMKIKFTNNSNIIYGIITKISYSSPNTTLTFLHEINPSTSQALHIMTNSAITNTYYSMLKAPFGFPLNPDKWSVTYSTDTTIRNTNATNETWWNLTNVNIDIPIGEWNISYKTFGYVKTNSATTWVYLSVALSTTTNSVSDNSLLYSIGYDSPTANLSINNLVLLARPATLILATKTKYYLNYLGGCGVGTLTIGNTATNNNIIIKATCTYL